MRDTNTLRAGVVPEGHKEENDHTLHDLGGGRPLNKAQMAINLPVVKAMACHPF